MRQVEVYKLVCWRCAETIEVPADSGPAGCPRCSAELQIQWRPEGMAETQPGASERAQSDSGAKVP